MELKPLFQNIADAIREKDGTVDSITASSFPARIRAIPSASAPDAVSPKDVNFYDYEGTLVYSYTLAEARALMALPKGPTHEGLVFQGWNWSLEKITALTRPMNVGAMYITDDGKTRLKIRVWDKARSNVPLYISQTAANGVTIDWGDGSVPETLDGTGKVNTAHQYAEAGEYMITFAVAEGCVLGFQSSILGPVNIFSRVYTNLLQGANIGYGVTTISYGAFGYCPSLVSITIPESVTAIGAGAFVSCSSLVSITIPEGVTSISSQEFQAAGSLASITIPDSVSTIDGLAFNNCGSLASITIPESVSTIVGMLFNYCSSLASITIPESVTAIGARAFSSCSSLASITIPESVTAIGSSAFDTCSGIAEYHLKPSSPPTLENADTFRSIAPDCIVYVPAGSLETYKTATNWSTYADYMREEG